MSLFRIAGLAGVLAAQPVLAGTLMFSDTGTFETSTGMWANTEAPLSAELKYYAASKNANGHELLGGIKTVDNSAARTAYDLALAACDYYFARSTCKNTGVSGPIGPKPTRGKYEPKLVYEGRVLAWNGLVEGCVFVGATRDFCINGIKPLGSRPPASYQSGRSLRLNEAEFAAGVKFDVSLGSGTVNASQAFSVDVASSHDEAATEEEVTLSFAGDKGQASFSSELGAVSAGVSALISAAIEAAYVQYNFGTKEYDATLVELSTGDIDLEVAGISLGNGGATLRVLEQDTVEVLTSGIEKSIAAPGIFPPKVSELLQAPLGSVTAFAPDFDVDPVVSQDGDAIEVSTVPTARAGDGNTPTDFFKVELDLDVASIYSTLVPLGLKGGIPLIGQVEGNLFDADLAGYFGMSQEQSFEAGDIKVMLEFSIPTEIEVADGVWELRSRFETSLNSEVKLRHPGSDLEITPTYRLADNVYSNMTQFNFSPTFEYDFFEVDFTGVALSSLGSYRLFGGVAPLGRALDLGNPIFDSAFALDGFEEIEGTRFTLAAAAIASEVPLPASGVLLFAALGGVGMIRRRR